MRNDGEKAHNKEIFILLCVWFVLFDLDLCFVWFGVFFVVVLLLFALVDLCVLFKGLILCFV